MTLAWLAGTSIVWGAAIVMAGLVLQRFNDLSGRARQWVWRGAAALLVAPWIAAPLVEWLNLGLAPAATPMPESMGFEPELVTIAPMVAVARERSIFEDINWEQALFLTLAAGWIIRFVAAQFAARRLGGIVATSVAAEPGSARASLMAWARKLKLKRTPELRIVESGVSPFSFGMIRPVVCLPHDLERGLDAESLDLVVGHECLHVARGDGWLRPIERVVADVFWFNPFAWRIRRELDMARELACDENVVEVTAARKAYAKTLRNVAGLAAGLSPSAPAASMSLAGGGRSLMMRVTRTLTSAKRRPARAALVGAATLALAGGCASVGQAMLATPHRSVAPNVHAMTPMRVVYAGALDDGALYAELEQTGGAIGKDRLTSCTLEAYSFDKLNVKTGQLLKPGAIVGTGKPSVNPTPQCWAMLDVAAPSAVELRREPRELASVGEKGQLALGRTQPAQLVKAHQLSARELPPSVAGLVPRTMQHATTTTTTTVENGKASSRTEVKYDEQQVAPVAPIPAPAPAPMPAPRAAPATVATPALPAPPAPPAVGYQQQAIAPLAPPAAIPAIRATPATPAAPALPVPAVVLNLDNMPQLKLSSGTAFKIEKSGLVRAAFPGVVKSVETHGDGTSNVKIGQTGPFPAGAKMSGENCMFDYGGLTKLRVKRGDQVKPGDEIGELSSANAVALSCRGLVVEGAAGVGLAPRAMAIAPGGALAVAPQALRNATRALEAPQVIRLQENQSGQTKVIVIDAPATIVGKGGRLTSGYGLRTDPFQKTEAFHPGVDIAQFLGATIQAPADGVIVFAGTKAAFGRVVDLDIGNGVRMSFGHLSSIAVKQGDKVRSGDKLGSMGSSGRNSTGPHLHFEIYKNGKAVDPQQVEGLTLVAPN